MGAIRCLGTMAAAVMVVLVAGGGVSGAAVTDETPPGRAAPTCRPANAPAVVGVDGASATLTVPACANPAGVTGYRVQAMNLQGTSALRSADVASGYGQAVITGLVPGTAYRYRVLARNGDGVGPASALSAATVQPFTTMAAFTDRQHRDLAGRAPTAAEASSWASRIGAGSLTPVAAIDSLGQAAYWQRQSPIIRLYQAYYLRLPDTAGLEYWVGLNRSGTSLNRISQSFSGTPEFRTLYGTLSDREFVERVYRNVLGRPGETSGINYWTAEITAGRRSRGSVMLGFSESPEYRAQTQAVVDVVNLFSGLIRRVPTSAERATWTPRTRAQIITFLLASNAYAARTRVVAPPAPGPLTGIRQLDAERSTTCGVHNTGAVYCWGYYFTSSVNAQLWLRARAVPGITTATKVAVGFSHTCAILTDKRLRCWGSNTGGQLGDGTQTSRTAPGVDPGLTGVVDVAAGQNNTCAVLESGAARCWGSNNSGQIGDGTKTGRLRPAAVSGLSSGVADIAISLNHACAVLSNGQGRCWGFDGYGQLGTEGAAADATTPQVVTGLTGAEAITTGDNGRSCARLGSGQVRCWGRGLIGDGSNGSSTPKTVTGITTASRVDASEGHICASLSNGTVRCWGADIDGRLGQGTAGSNAPNPIAVTGLSGVGGVTLGDYHSCARLTSGEVRCWGGNNNGEVGDGSRTRRLAPVTVFAE